jgi:hypothetical protein
MGRRKKKSNRYWTGITEVAIQAYNKCEDRPVMREKIYRRFIFAPLMKMSETRINQMKPDYIDKSFADLQTDLVTYLTERLCKIKPGKGRGYSYFTRTSWNYLIAENSKAYKALKSKTDEFDLDENRNVLAEQSNSEIQENLKEFWDEFVDYCYDNINYIFTNSMDIHVADSVLHFFEERHNIEEYNKKALYILIRERAGLDMHQTNYVTKVMKTLMQIYYNKFEEYKQSEFMNLPF